jgi:hypothetical protein
MASRTYHLLGPGAHGVDGDDKVSGLEFIRAALDDFATALEARNSWQLRFDAVDALNVVDVCRVDGSVEHLEANLTRCELAGGKLGELDDVAWLAEGCEAGGRRHVLKLIIESRFFESCFSVTLQRFCAGMMKGECLRAARP